MGEVGQTKSSDWFVWDNDLGYAEGKVADKISAGFMPSENRIAQWEGIGWLPHEPGWSVVDIACGNGNYYKLLSEEYGMKYTGCDLSDTMLSIASGMWPKAVFVQGDASNLPFEDGLFDMSFCSDLLLHVPGNLEEKIASEVYRVASKAAVIHTRSLITHPRLESRDKDNAIIRYEPIEEDLKIMRSIYSRVEMHVRNERKIGNRIGADIFWVFSKE